MMKRKFGSFFPQRSSVLKNKIFKYFVFDHHSVFYNPQDMTLGGSQAMNLTQPWFKIKICV